ncbi:hypothetical protein SAY87_010757 [Trapa incisa]|uniref:Uncharacterized protein n=1 Tax=Trapa incisa TaxID=236973 RepID=A0AAN7JIF3_9MYRT|nr:hypothetical protein SAY87_010757 [Trapa incisa]
MQVALAEPPPLTPLCTKRNSEGSLNKISLTSSVDSAATDVDEGCTAELLLHIPLAVTFEGLQATYYALELINRKEERGDAGWIIRSLEKS